MTKRYTQLDSLRGLAAVTVVLCHCFYLPSVFYQTKTYWLLAHTPLAFFRAGHEAVILFFILSGFVLSLPFYRGPVRYGPFLAKRFCRICLPYYAAILFAAWMSATVSRHGIPALGPWFNYTWDQPPTFRLIAQHFLLIGTFQNGELNTAVWSLIHEMRVSLVFPLLMWPILRLKWTHCLGLAALLSLTGTGLMKVQFILFHTKLDYPLTLHYVSLFIAGALLAKHRATLTQWCAALPRPRKALLLLGAVCIYTCPFWSPLDRLPGGHYLLDWAIGLGASLLIVLSLAASALHRFLSTPPMRHLGSTSYSIYLFHGTILFALTYQLYGKSPMSHIWLLTLAGTLLLSWVTYHLIERPSIKLGRKLAERMGRTGIQAGEDLVEPRTKYNPI